MFQLLCSFYSRNILYISKMPSTKSLIFELNFYHVFNIVLLHRITNVYQELMAIHSVIFYITLEYCMKIMLSFSFTEICQFQQLRVFLDNIQTAHWLFQCDKKQIKLLSKFGSCGVETDITVFFYLFNQLHFGSHPSFNFSLFISKVVVDGSH